MIEETRDFGIRQYSSYYAMVNLTKERDYKLKLKLK